eukprot:1663559-Pyramimonas_sp.AAC.1
MLAHSAREERRDGGTAFLSAQPASAPKRTLKLHLCCRYRCCALGDAKSGQGIVIELAADNRFGRQLSRLRPAPGRAGRAKRTRCNLGQMSPPPVLCRGQGR